MSFPEDYQFSRTRHLILFILTPIPHRSLGYQYKNGRIESQQQYLARIIGLQRLYSAIMITPVRQSQNADAHPFGIQNGWIWIANFLNIEPLPDVCPTLLTEFLQVAGAEMWKTYKNQFQKLIVFIHQQYIPQLDMVNIECQLGPID